MNCLSVIAEERRGVLFYVSGFHVDRHGVTFVWTSCLDEAYVFSMSSGDLRIGCLSAFSESGVVDSFIFLSVGVSLDSSGDIESIFY